MPYALMPKDCIICGRVFQTRDKKARACDRRCGAYLREREKTREWRTPRDYPPSLVEHVRRLYEAGATIGEIQQRTPGVKVQRLMVRCGIPARSAVPRNQRGAANASWRGDAAGYQALHLRVADARGKPSLCEQCGTTEGRHEWANLTGHYADPYDYKRMCVACHRRYDSRGRRPNGQFPRRGEVVPDV